MEGVAGGGGVSGWDNWPDDYEVLDIDLDDEPDGDGTWELLKPVRRLVVVYDVTGLSDDQIAALDIEAVVQAESSRPGEGTEAGHPSVPVGSWVEDEASRIEWLDEKVDLDG